MKKKTSKASKSFSNLNTKNLIPRPGTLINQQKQRKKKNYLYDNGKNYESRIRNSNSIYNNRKGKKCYSLIGESVRRLKYNQNELDTSKVAGNKRRLRNLVRDKSMKLMQDYSNKNLGKKKLQSDVPNTVQINPSPKDDFNHLIEEKLRLLKTKLVHKSYEESKGNKALANPLVTPVKNPIDTIEENMKDNEDEQDIPKAPFNSITMREVTPRFKEDSMEKSNVLKNSCFLKRRAGYVFENEFLDSTGKKEDDSFALGDFFRRYDPSNIFNSEDTEATKKGALCTFNLGNVLVHKIGKIEEVSQDPMSRVNVLNYLRTKYTTIMNN